MTSEQIADICSRMAEGNSLRKVCRELDMKESSVRYWLMKDAEAFAHSACARELGCDALADECVDIADDPVLDPAEKRVRIDTRIRLIGKWSQRYSEKVDVTTKTEVTHRYDFGTLDDDALARIEGALESARPLSLSPPGEGAAEPDIVH